MASLMAASNLVGATLPEVLDTHIAKLKTRNSKSFLLLHFLQQTSGLPAIFLQGLGVQGILAIL